MRDHRYFDTLATTNTGVRERQAPKNLIPNHAPGFRSEVTEGRDRRNVSAKNTPRKRRSTFSTLTENSGPLPNATVPLFQNGGDRWSPQQSLQTTYGHFEEKSGYHADAGSHNSKRRQRAMTVRYDEGMGHSPNTKFPEDRSTKLSYSPVDSRAPDPPEIPSEYPEDQRIYKESPDTPGGSRTKPRSLAVTHKPVQTNLVEETPPGEQGVARRNRESKHTTPILSSRSILSPSQRKVEVFSPEATASLYESPRHEDLATSEQHIWKEHGAAHARNQIQLIELGNKEKRTTKTPASELGQESSLASSGVTHYVTASDRSTDIAAHGATFSSQIQLHREVDNISGSRLNGDPHHLDARTARSISQYRNTRVHTGPTHPSSLPVDAADTKSGPSGPYMLSRTRSPVFNTITEIASIPSQVSRPHEKRVNGTDPNKLHRNDDSLTYVAVTASSHPTDSDVEALSEASNYVDHEYGAQRSPLLDEAEIYLQKAQAIKRRDALLNGLGLGLSFPKEEEIIASTTSDRPNIDTHFKGSPLTWQAQHPDWRNSTHNAGFAQARQKLATSNKTSDHAEVRIPAPPNAERTPTTNQRSPTSPNQEALSEQGRNPSERKLPHKRSKRPLDDKALKPVSNRRVSKADIRRNTWVYDEGKDGPIRATQEDSQPEYGDERSDSAGIIWSESENMKPLSENAQQMFNQLEDRLQVEGETPRKPKSATEHPNESVIIQHTPSQTQVSDGTKDYDSESMPRTWRKTISPSAYQSLLDRYGISEMKRQDVLFELCETESDFVRSLKVILQLFVEPLRSRGHWVTELPPVCVNLLSALDAIVAVHSQLSLALQSGRASQFPLMLRFADVVRPFVPRLEVHQPYLVYLDESMKEFDKIIRDPDSTLGDFLRNQSAQEASGSMGISSLLLKPMQRLTKYPLFFKQIWELTPRSHVDHLSAFSLYYSTDLVIKVIQEVKAREEEYRYMVELASRIDNFPTQFQLAHRERRLVSQGLLRKVAISEKEKQLLDAQPSSKSVSRIQSPQLGTSWSPASSEITPIVSTSSKFTSPSLSPAPNRAFIPTRQGHIQRQEPTWRNSEAFSEVSHSSEGNSSPNSSMTLSSDAESVARLESITRPQFPRSTVVFPSYGRSSPNLPRGAQLSKGTRRKGARETPIYVFVFTDMAIFVSQAGKGGLLQSRSQVPTENMSLVQSCGLSRIVGVSDVSEKLDYEHLLQVDILPIDPRSPSTGTGVQPSVISVYFTLPAPSGAHIGLNTIEQVRDAKVKWLSAFNRSYEYTARALSFPFIVREPSPYHPEDVGMPSVIAVLASGQLLPKGPGDVEDLADDLVQEYSGEWWDLQFRRVLRDIERIQDTPVLLIGDVALTMAKGLSRVHTTDRMKRSGPQQLLLPMSNLLSSPTTSSGSSHGGMSILGPRKRNKI
ncbi:hypothetical protein FRB91_011131 [Serendipita sp. 411]|nr:hypothetical protein FRB91_011131 [Serendipita sp. 411]